MVARRPAGRDEAIGGARAAVSRDHHHALDAAGRLRRAAPEARGREELAQPDPDVLADALDQLAHLTELVCFLPGHHAAGQKLAFQVR